MAVCSYCGCDPVWAGELSIETSLYNMRKYYMNLHRNPNLDNEKKKKIKKLKSSVLEKRLHVTSTVPLRKSFAWLTEEQLIQCVTCKWIPLACWNGHWTEEGDVSSCQDGEDNMTNIYWSQLSRKQQPHLVGYQTPPPPPPLHTHTTQHPGAR